MLKLTINLLLPAAGILLAALTQLALTTVWSGIRTLPTVVVSIDSYLTAMLALGLCLVAGAWAHRIFPTIAGLVGAVIVPLVWFSLLIASILMTRGSVGWLRPITLIFIFTAMAPLVGVILGWAMSSSKRTKRAAFIQTV